MSMGRVAAELKAAPMSLYRHVASKEELIRLMVDAAWGDSPGPLSSGENWRAGLSRWAWAMRAALRRHAWAAHIPITGLPIMPREIAWFEDALACMAGTRLTEARKASVIMLLSGYVRNLAWGTQRPRPIPHQAMRFRHHHSSYEIGRDRRREADAWVGARPLARVSQATSSCSGAGTGSGLVLRMTRVARTAAARTPIAPTVKVVDIAAV